MKNLIFTIALVLLWSCKTNKSDNEKLETKSMGNEVINDQRPFLSNPNLHYTKETNTIEDSLKTTEQYAEKREGFKQYDLNDTIFIDLNGNGRLEKIFFSGKDCKQINIENDSGQVIAKVGCHESKYLKYPDLVDWVDEWGIVSKKNVWEMLIKENGDLDKDTIIELERPSIYLQKQEVGGGIITYRNGKLYWIHQSD